MLQAVLCGKLLVHFLKCGYISRREKYALLSGQLVGYHIAAFLRNEVARTALTFSVLILGFYEKINQRNFALVKNFAVSSYCAKKFLMRSFDFLRDLSAVGVKFAVNIFELNFVNCVSSPLLKILMPV